MRLSLILLIVVPMVGCTTQRPMPIRPVTVQVVDQQTKKPLEGITVLYSLYTTVVQRYVLLVIPSTEPDVGPKIAYKAQAVTDKNGVALFHARDFMLPENERFDMESIVINMDVNMSPRVVQTAKWSLELGYSEGKVRRDGPVDNIDLVENFLIQDRKMREEVLFRPNARYGCAVIRSNAYSPYGKGELSGWFEKDENCTISFNGDSLEKSKDFVVVSLKPN